MGQWVETLGQQLGVQLGRVIAEHLQRTLEESVDLGRLARRMGSGIAGGERKARPGTRGGRSGSGKPVCGEPGCASPVLAKGLCRSHYYRARYQSQKGGRPARRGKRIKRAARSSTPAPSVSTP